MNVALLGPSGVGKGTHAASLAARYHLRHVATGDLFRHHVVTRSALGRLAQRYMAEGELVPDEVVDAMIDEWGDSLGPDDGTLFDGFPRTSDQMRFLDGLFARLGRRLDAAIYLYVPDAVIARRLTGRLVCAGCQVPYHAELQPPRSVGRCDRCGAVVHARPDDTPALVQARLRVFHRAGRPVLEHYAAAGKLMIVSGQGTMDEVEQSLRRTFDGLGQGTACFATAADIADLQPAAPPPASPRPALELPSLTFALLGGPGSGKGTQAERLSATLHLPHVATGDLFRENLREGTALGQLAKSYMNRGELVPDDVTDAIIEERLARADARDGFILDGFPRTLPQAEALHEILARQHRQLAAVLYINVPDATIMLRLSGRMICRDCQSPYHLRFNPPRQPGVCDRCAGPLFTRADDVPETVATRLVTFHRQTEPLIDYYRRAGLLHEIAGHGDVTEVAGRCLAQVRDLANKLAARPLADTIAV